MTKRKRIEAWAVTSPDGQRTSLYFNVNGVNPKCKTVRLVEHSPATDAVAIAACKFIEQCCFAVQPSKKKYLRTLVKAVERLEREMAK